MLKSLFLITVLFNNLVNCAAAVNQSENDQKVKILLKFDFNFKEIEEKFTAGKRKPYHIVFFAMSKRNDIWKSILNETIYIKKKKLKRVTFYGNLKKIQYFAFIIDKICPGKMNKQYQIMFGNPAKLWNKKYSFAFNKKNDEGWVKMQNYIMDDKGNKKMNDEIYMLTEDIE